MLNLNITGKNNNGLNTTSILDDCAWHVLQAAEEEEEEAESYYSWSARAKRLPPYSINTN